MRGIGKTANDRMENAGIQEGHQPHACKHSQPWQTQGIQGLVRVRERWLHLDVATDGAYL